MIDLNSGWVTYAAVGLIGLAFAIFLVPVYKRPWVIELGMLALVLALMTVVLGIAETAWILNPWAGLVVLLALLGYLAFWLPPSRRRLDVDTEGMIAAPPESVFACATDPAFIHQPKNMTVVSMRIDGNGGVKGEGARLITRIRSGALRLEGVDVITAWDPPRRYADRTLGTGSEVTYVIEPRGGGTYIRTEYRGMLSMSNAILTGYSRSKMLQNLRQLRLDWMEAIRQRLAAGA
jgi:hypothetical protein